MHMTLRYGGNVHSRSEQHTNEFHKSERRDISLGQSIFSLALSRYDRSSSLVMVQFIEVPIDLLHCNIEHKMWKKKKDFFMYQSDSYFFPKKEKRPFFFQLFICFLWMPSKLHLHSEKKTCFQAKIISNQEMNLGTHIFFILKKKMCIQKELRLAIRQKINKNAGISNSTTKKSAYNQLVILCLAYFSCKTPKLEVLHFCGKII